MPVLRCNGKVYFESKAELRMIGACTGQWSAKCAKEAYVADANLDFWQGVVNALSGAAFAPTDEAKMEAVQKACG